MKALLSPRKRTSQFSKKYLSIPQCKQAEILSGNVHSLNTYPHNTKHNKLKQNILKTKRYHTFIVTNLPTLVVPC